MDEAPTGTELAMLRGEVMTSLAQIQGDIRLVLQEQQHAARRTDDLQADMRQMDGRMDTVERTTVTRDELDKRVAQLRERLGEQRADDQQRADRRLKVAAIVVTVVVGLLASGVTLIGIIVR